MRISDWSSDVCSSDLPEHLLDGFRAVLRDGDAVAMRTLHGGRAAGVEVFGDAVPENRRQHAGIVAIDRKSVVEGKSVSVRVDLGGRRIIKKKKSIENHNQSITEIND